MQTSARSRIAIGAITLLTGLAVASLGEPIAAQTHRTNPLRTHSNSSPVAPRQPVSATGYNGAAAEGGPSAYGGTAAARTVGFVPKHEKVASQAAGSVRKQSNVQPRGFRPAQHAVPIQADSVLQLPAPGVPISDQSIRVEPGEVLVEGPVWEGDVFADEGPLMPVPAGVPGGDCCDGGGCAECCLPCPLLPWENLELHGGTHGFTGAANRGETGSFGFHYGLNWGTPLPIGALGGQIGLNLVHSNFSGGEFTNDTRNQLFLTGGIFRRVDWGLQGGIVVDYMRDDWYLELDLVQLRGELSWVFPQCHELGFWFTASTRDHSTLAVVFDGLDDRLQLTENYDTNDLFAFFYRRRFQQTGAEGRLFAGFSGQSDGLIGADIRLPISHRLSLRSEFTYLIPEDRVDSLDHRDENWNVGLSLVWHIGPPALGCHSYYRPLFNVANNGNFLIRRR